MHKNFGEDRTCSSEDMINMIVDRQTNKQTHTHTHTHTLTDTLITPLSGAAE